MDPSDKDKSSFRLALEILPFHRLLERIYRFICDPKIFGDKVNESDLRYAVRDFLEVNLSISAFMAFFKHLVPNLFATDPIRIINLIYLFIFLVLPGLFLSYLIAAIASIFLLPRTIKFHHVIAHQAIRAFAILDFFIVIILAMTINRILVTGKMEKLTGTADLWLSLIVIVGTCFFGWRCLIQPVFNYMARFYPRRKSILLCSIIFPLSLFINGHISFDLGFGHFLIDRPEFCKSVYEIKRKNDKIPATVDAQCFIRHCIEANPL